MRGSLGHVYFSCGHSQCSICQSIKREQWMDKMSSELLKVPYVHLVTTMPHQLNSLARTYSKRMYDILFRATNLAVHTAIDRHVVKGGKAGLISVLHTFGSDMKYHVHVHSLVTFGAVSKEGTWHKPTSRKRICKYADMRGYMRHHFMKLLDKAIEERHIQPTIIQQQSIEQVRHVTWSFRVTPPTMNTQHIELYLARYINRIAVTNSRVRLAEDQRQVYLTYNDYRNQKEGQAAPKAVKPMDPLSFIHQYLQHRTDWSRREAA